MIKNKITAVLGPTNTGKTHLAIETMLSFESGMIGFPLRLLAREVYDKVIKKISLNKVALITGEEKVFDELSESWSGHDKSVAYIAAGPCQQQPGRRRCRSKQVWILNS